MKPFLFEEEYNNLIKELNIKDEDVPFKLDEIEEMWDSFKKINTEKGLSGNIDTLMTQLSKMYIMEYYYYALAVIDDEENVQVQFLFKALFLDIANTAYAIYKLAVDGFDYQAKVLLRNLYELCMTLLNIEIDAEKRMALFESAKEENERDIWYKYFKPSKLQKTLIEFGKSIGGFALGEWHRREYGQLSSYVHNHFLSFFLYSYAFPGEEEAMKPNFCGHFVTRTEFLLNDMNGILFYTGLVFLKGLGYYKGEITKEILCGEKKSMESPTNHDFWDCATFMELLNRKCAAKILLVQEDDEN